MTLREALQAAVRHHRAGRLAEAEALYRQVLAAHPQQPNALHLLGVIALQVGQWQAAIDLIGQALALRPNWAEALSNLGAAMKGAGRLDDAISAYRQSLALQPGDAEVHVNLGNALLNKGLLDEAIAAYRQAAALRPSYAEAHASLGNALWQKGLVDQAVWEYRQALSLRPDDPQALCGLGLALADTGQPDEALTALRKAVALRPQYPEAHNNLGAVLARVGQLEQAIQACNEAISLRPDYAQAHTNLGIALRIGRRLQEAIAAHERAVALRPDDAVALSNLGNALNDAGQVDRAIAALRRAVDLRPDLAEAHSNLGDALKGIGEIDAAIEALRRAVVLRPDCAAVHSNLVLACHYAPDYSAQALAEEARRWNQQHAEPLRAAMAAHVRDRQPDRPLRVGYVSPDLCDHVVGRNILPLLEHHDRTRYEVFAYADVAAPDAMTQRMRRLCTRWRSIVGLGDAQVAEMIRQDRIDILVDLALHTAGNRLLVFARKPAPVQVTFAGYPGSTGLTAIDYRLSDPYLDPPGCDESVYSEKTVRLPHSFWCYDPLDCGDIPTGPLPALDKGYITFGCLNNFCKINQGVLRLWVQVMKQIGNSRLLLLSAQGSHRQRTLDFLEQEGVNRSRVDFCAHCPRRQYMQLYHRIDIGLDSFPYNGHTTSLDSFWMGVPVITLVGDRAVARAGWCQLSNLGLAELAGQTPEQFVRIATELAGDLPRLSGLRATMRDRMQRSPLMDAAAFARDIEAAYRQMWRTWCQAE